MSKKFKVILLILIVSTLFVSASFAEPISIPKITLGIDEATEPQETVTTIQVILLLTVLTLAPSILILMTSFTRIIIVLSFLRSALGTNQMPPNQVMVGLALFLTFFIMSPTFSEINDKALQPYLANEIGQQEAYDNAVGSVKNFMLRQLRGESDLALFVEIAELKEVPKDLTELPLTIIVPAFAISELKIAFQMGFVIYIPFLIIDMIVSSTLMSMGMMMLPPSLISMPFKLLLFILVDGWNLVIRTIVSGFVR